MTKTLSGQANRVLAALAEGRRFRRRADGWACGPLAAPDTLLAELERRDLVGVAGGALALGPAGEAWARRRVEAGNRLLADRP